MYGKLAADSCLLKKIFATTPVPGVNTCVPGRTQWALSNGKIGFLPAITNNEIPTKQC